MYPIDHAESTEKCSYLANTSELSIMLMTAFVLDAKLAIKHNQAFIYIYFFQHQFEIGYNRYTDSSSIIF